MGMVKVARQGGCHCGAVRYAAQVPDPLRAGRCNCSICAKKGVAMVRIAQADLTLTQGQESLSCYRFNTMVAEHWFCRHCGIHVYHRPRSDPSIYALNAATLDGVRVYEDFPEIPVNDGIHHMKDHGGVSRLAGILRFTPTAQ